MGLFDRKKNRADTVTKSDEETAEFETLKALETAKVRAYRTADEMAGASRKLMLLALELRKEIEAIEND